MYCYQFTIISSLLSFMPQLQSLSLVLCSSARTKQRVNSPFSPFLGTSVKIAYSARAGLN